MLDAGFYEAKVSDYGVKLSSRDTMIVMIRFKTKDDNYLTWTGSLVSEQSREVVYRTLFVCGWNGNKLEDLANGSSSGTLDTEKTVTLNVDTETNERGKTYNIVKFVNEPGGGKFQDALSKEEVIKRLSGVDATTEIDEARKKFGYQTKTETTTTNFDDLPF